MSSPPGFTFNWKMSVKLEAWLIMPSNINNIILNNNRGVTINNTYTVTVVSYYFYLKHQVTDFYKYHFPSICCFIPWCVYNLRLIP